MGFRKALSGKYTTHSAHVRNLSHHPKNDELQENSDRRKHDIQNSILRTETTTGKEKCHTES